MAEDEDTAQVKRLQVVAIVIVATTLLWGAAQWVGPRIGLSGGYAFVFDLMALAAFFWALATVAHVWHKRHNK
ncbi:MAG: DUF5337 family protein [Paracoccaceae bacterium]